MHSKARRRALEALCVLLALAAVSAPLTTGACGRSRPKTPNVLLVSVDTLRADHLGCYGYERPTSPRLDAFAKEGTLFERAIAPTSWTLPSHVTMLSGLSISAHGACDDRLWSRKSSAGKLEPPPLRGHLVSESLKAAGYATAGFYTFEFLDATFGFARGFDLWERCGHRFYTDPAVGAEFLALRLANDVEGVHALMAKHPELFDERRRSSGETVDRAGEWLAAHEASKPSEPFFLFVHLFDAHEPYKPPPEHDRFGDARFKDLANGQIDPKYAADSGVTPPAGYVDRTVALYDGGVHYVDHEVGRLLDRMKELDLDDDTLVIVASDHGEEFWEHGKPTHREQLYVESVHVPLIVRWPGHVPAGKRVAETAGLVDVVPTILEATGARALSPASGVSLLPVARGESTTAGRIYETLLHRFEADASGKEHLVELQVGLFRGRRHSIVGFCPMNSFHGEEYDLELDPREEAPPRTFGPDDPLGVDFTAQLDAIARGTRGLRERLPERGSALKLPRSRIARFLESAGYAGGADVESASPENAATRVCSQGCVFLE